MDSSLKKIIFQAILLTAFFSSHSMDIDYSDVDSMIASDNIRHYVYSKINTQWDGSNVFDETFGFNFDSDNLYTFAFNTG